MQGHNQLGRQNPHQIYLREEKKRELSAGLLPQISNQAISNIHILKTLHHPFLNIRRLLFRELHDDELKYHELNGLFLMKKKADCMSNRRPS